MFVKARCKKCGNEKYLDIGDMKREEVIKNLSNEEFGECKFGGFHVEIGKMTDYIEIDWSTLTDHRLKKYKIPCVWQKKGILTIEAKSLKEAEKIAIEDSVLPDGYYIDDSFQVDKEDPNYGEVID